MSQESETQKEKNGENERFRAPYLGMIIFTCLILWYVIYRFSFNVSDLSQKYIFFAQSLLNIVLFAAIAIQAAIYVGQWRVMRDSLEQTRTQLGLVERQIDLEYTAQRPWLFLVPDPEFIPEINVGYLHWQIRNRGKTTARIINAGFRADLGRMASYNLPAIPEYGSNINFHNMALAPEGNLEAFANIRVDGLVGYMSQDDIDKLERTDLDLIAYGFVRYSDTKGEHESRTCLYWAHRAGKFWINIHMPEPAEYHKYT